MPHRAKGEGPPDTAGLRKSGGPPQSPKKQQEEQNQQQQQQCSDSPSSHSHSLLRGMLLELGLTDTARVLDEEAQRLLSAAQCRDRTPRGSPSLPGAHNRGPAAGAAPAPTAGGPSGRLPARRRASADMDPEGEVRGALLHALAPAHGAESDVACVLRELCRRGLAEIMESDESAADEIAPLVRRLTHALIPSNECQSNANSNGNGNGSANGTSAGWNCLSAVFAAYASVLWAQLRLAEVVAAADCAPHGWTRWRAVIVARLARLQEALQRLLLEADQFDRSGHSMDGNSEWRSGVAALFGHGAPALRRNANEVAAWIMRQCSRGGRGRAAAPSTEPFPPANGMDMSHPHPNDSDSGENNGISEARRFVRKPWEVLLGVVRHVVLAGPARDSPRQNPHNNNNNNNNTNNNNNNTNNNNNNKNEEEKEKKKNCEPQDRDQHSGSEGANASRTLPALRWDFALLRVELLAWVIGSAAEIAETARGRSSASCSDALIGVWYQRCAAQLREDKAFSLSSPLSSSFASSSSAAAVAADCVPMGNDANGSARVFIVEALRRTALEILAEPSPASEFGALRVLLQSYASDNTNNNNINSSSMSGSNYGAEDRLMLLAALATGRPFHREPSRDLVCRVPLQCVVRSALCAPRALLELQADGIPVDAQLQIMENMSVSAFARQKKSLMVHTSNASGEDVSPDEHCYSSEPMKMSGNTRGTGIAAPAHTFESAAEVQRRVPERSRLSIGAGDRTLGIDAPMGPLGGNAERLSLGGLYFAAFWSSFMRRAVRMTAISRSALPPATDGDGEGEDEGEGVGVEEGEEGEEEEEVGNVAGRPNRSRDKVWNEVQVVTVSNCGTLMAFLTTKGRLVVFALRGGGTAMGSEAQRDMGSFCEELILDTLIINEKQEPCWYEQLAVFLSFSPDARFLLCSVQNAPSWVKEGKESRRLLPASNGKIRIYSLHKNTNHITKTPGVSNTEGHRDNVNDKSGSRNGDPNGSRDTSSCHVDSKNENDNNKNCMNDSDSVNRNVERLYGNFKIHAAPVTVARWVDPRFWRERKKTVRYNAPDANAPLWRRVASWHLSQLQCLSTGRDNLIIRWSPADGSIIQRIATYPVYDILVSPLMQAFYTINQLGQLSMYDAWNEHSVEDATDNFILVSQRGLPSALSAMHLPVDTREDGRGTKPAVPLADGERSQDFFVGARRIRFDRRCVAQGWADAENVGAHVSRVIQSGGFPIRAETRAGGRLGRRILLQMLRRGEDYSVPHARAVLQSASRSSSSSSSLSSSVSLAGDDGSDGDSNSNDSNNNGEGEEEEEEERGAQRAVHGSGRRRRHRARGCGDGPYGAQLHESSLSFLRAQNLYGGCDANDKDRGVFAREVGGEKEEDTINRDAILYRTGARLVFEEVSRALCFTLGIWPNTQESDYAPSPQPFNLLSMSASGNAAWGEDEECGDRGPLVCHRCGYGGRVGAQSTLYSDCAYYSDRPRAVSNDGNGIGEVNGRAANGKSPVTSLRTKQKQEQQQSVLCMCRRSRKSARALAPTARNGRYICITASVGPCRSLVQYDRSLEFHAGIYACVVFDVLYGTVVRVIPVCPTQPRAALTENGEIVSHSHAKKAPIYAIPCSMTLVQRPTGTTNTMDASAATLPVTPRHSKANANNITVTCANENGNGFGSLQRGSSDSFSSCQQEADSILLVAVGGLHSTTYVFDALSGARLKVINMRKNKTKLSSGTVKATATRAKEARPPSKRIRRSYVSLGEPESARQRRSSMYSKEVDEYEASDNAYDELEAYDSESSDAVSENLYLFDEEQQQQQQQQKQQQQLHVDDDGDGDGDGDDEEKEKERHLQPRDHPTPEDRRRHSLIRQLMDRYGTPAVLQATVEILRVVPLPFPVLRAGPPPVFSRCPSFIGQLRLSVENVSGHRKAQSLVQQGQQRQSRGDATDTMPALCHNVPFALLAEQQQQLRRVLASDGAGEEAAHSQKSHSEDISTRLRCGVVNSVALFYDSANGGVYVFSSDELGGLFMAGGLMRK